MPGKSTKRKEMNSVDVNSSRKLQCLHMVAGLKIESADQMVEEATKIYNFLYPEGESELKE